MSKYMYISIKKIFIPLYVNLLLALLNFPLLNEDLIKCLLSVLGSN
jgi:hypothetical protein